MLLRRRMMFECGKLPSEYQEVEYIQNSSVGNQYIDLGTLSGTNYEFEIKVEVISKGNYSEVLSIPRQYRGYGMGIRCPDATKTLFAFVSGSQIGGTSVEKISMNSLHSLKWQDGNYYIDDVAYSDLYDYKDKGFNGNIRLFNTNNPTYLSTYGTICKLYYLKMWTTVDGVKTLQRDLIPCYKKETEEIGVYDLVKKEFLTNGGTNTTAWTHGAEI